MFQQILLIKVIINRGDVKAIKRNKSELIFGGQIKNRHYHINLCLPKLLKIKKPLQVFFKINQLLVTAVSRK